MFREKLHQRLTSETGGVYERGLALALYSGSIKEFGLHFILVGRP